jgi:hypothetical protein
MVRDAIFLRGLLFTTPIAGVLMPEARQEFWQILSQWMWNLRLELGQHLSPTPMQTTAFAPVLEASQVPPVEQMAEALQASTVVYGPAQWARPSWTSGFPGSAFTLQPDGSLLCPANRPLYPQERREDARWLVSSFVCRSHPRLSRLSPACPVSRKQFHCQTTTGECGVLASLSPRSGFCCSCFKWG